MIPSPCRRPSLESCLSRDPPPAHRALPAVPARQPPERVQYECTRLTAEALEKGKPDGRGKLVAIGVGVASVAVRPHNVPRALTILDALCEAAEDAGLSISAKSVPAVLVVAAVQVPFALIEISAAWSLLWARVSGKANGFGPTRQQSG